MAKKESMYLIEFQKRFTSEASCQDHLFKMKWPESFICEKCGHGHYYETTTHKLFFTNVKTVVIKRPLPLERLWRGGELN